MKVLKFISTFLVASLLMSLSTITGFAAEEKEFSLEQSQGYTQTFTVTNLTESEDGYNPDFKIKAQAPSSIAFYFIFSSIKITYENEEYSDESGKSISSIVKESGKDIIPDGPVLPQHYNTGYTLVFEKSGNYTLELLYCDYTLKISLDIVDNNSETAETDDNVKALPTSSKVLVNGTEVLFDAYNINGNNYFKLRDLAMAVNGTDKQFEVTWDGAKNAISLESGKGYTAVGGELATASNPSEQNALVSTAKIYVDGKETALTAYTINGNNYFKLRDIAGLFDIEITWDEETKTIGINT